MADVADDVILTVEGLSVEYRSRGQSTRVLSDVDLALGRNEIVGLVGESGSGKSTLASAIMRLLPPSGHVSSGRILLHGTGDLAGLSDEQLRQARGRKIAMIFQDPLSALNPTFRIGSQMVDVQQAHAGDRMPRLGRRELSARAVSLLRQVGLPDPGQVARSYPHQLSGGMRQRVLIAMALSLEPELLIADESTSALDATIAAQILSLLAEIHRERKITILFVTHDLGLVAKLCQRVAVMYAGQIVEQGPVADVFDQPQHPYTEALLAAVPSRAHRGRQLAAIPGQVPSFFDDLPGCRFATRCGYAQAVCHSDPPKLVRSGVGDVVRCHMRDPSSSFNQAPPSLQQVPSS